MGAFLAIFTSRIENGAVPGPISQASGNKTLTLFSANYRAEKNEKLN